MNGNLLCKNRNSVKDFEAVWTRPQGFLPRPLASTPAAGRREAAGKRSRAPRVRARLAEAPSAARDSADRAPRGVRGGLVADSTAARFACRPQPPVRGPAEAGAATAHKLHPGQVGASPKLRLLSSYLISPSDAS